MEYTTEQELIDVSMERPHVVLLGAGASRAAFPHGDANGKKLPVMADFVEVLGLGGIIDQMGLPNGANIEELYKSNVEEFSNNIERVNGVISDYFGSLQLPDEATIYDHLIMSLRGKDYIATFNWDPFLIQAYRRVPKEFPKPRLLFLHGAVNVGYCEADRVVGVLGANCSTCNQGFIPTPLLYPIGEKDYTTNPAIQSQWYELRKALSAAFMLTVFGYGAPKSDLDAVSYIKQSWGAEREMEQVEFISLEAPDHLRAAWEGIVYSHHYEVHSNFFDSWIGRHPRRTGEAHRAQYWNAKFVDDNRAVISEDIYEVREWYCRFMAAEGVKL